jgi:hypothetical protein
MEKAKRARKAETPKQPSHSLISRAPYLYLDRGRHRTSTYGNTYDRLRPGGILTFALNVSFPPKRGWRRFPEPFNTPYLSVGLNYEIQVGRREASS